MSKNPPENSTAMSDELRWALQRADGFIDLRLYDRARATLAELPEPFRNEHVYKLIELRLELESANWPAAARLAAEMRDLMPKVPGFWIELAYATRRADGLEAAHAILKEAFRRFPAEAVIPYNLACYECQLGHPDRAMSLLCTTFNLDSAFRDAALDDEDLAPVWERLMS